MFHPKVHLSKIMKDSFDQVKDIFFNSLFTEGCRVLLDAFMAFC